MFLLKISPVKEKLSFSKKYMFYTFGIELRLLVKYYLPRDDDVSKQKLENLGRVVVALALMMMPGPRIVI